MRTIGGCCDVGALRGSKELQMAFPYLEEGTLAPYFPECPTLVGDVDNAEVRGYMGNFCTFLSVLL